MDEEKQRRFVGPIEELEWPEKLKAHVVTPGPQPRIHGYDVEGDLAKHYSFAETILITLTGELPDAKTGRAFEIALQFLAPISVAEAPVHAAAIARLCGAAASGVHEVGTVALAEQARFLLAKYDDFFVWLSNPSDDLPRRHILRKSDRHGDTTARLLELLSAIGYDVPALQQHLTLEAGVVAVLFSCGLTELWQFEAAFIVAKLATLSAEAHANSAGVFNDYPLDYPSFRYCEK